jgi:CO dehydrogenase/acetyl-CoA synthase gamma subunit (corrinoid Fe-S protein)
MTIEEIDLYKLKAEDLERYLPDGDASSCGAKSWNEYAQMLVAKKVKASDCAKLDKNMAAAIDAALSIDIRLPESDPMQQKVPEKLIEFNSPDASSPILLTSNSIITHQMLKLIFDASKAKAFVIPVDTNGYTLDNSVVAGTLTPMAVMKAITESGIAGKSSSRKAILPGLAKDLKGNIERITRWGLEIGPVSGFELPMYLLKR